MNLSPSSLLQLISLDSPRVFLQRLTSPWSTSAPPQMTIKCLLLESPSSTSTTPSSFPCCLICTNHHQPGNKGGGFSIFTPPDGHGHYLFHLLGIRIGDGGNNKDCHILLCYVCRQSVNKLVQVRDDDKAEEMEIRIRAVVKLRDYYLQTQKPDVKPEPDNEESEDKGVLLDALSYCEADMETTANNPFLSPLEGSEDKPSSDIDIGAFKVEVFDNGNDDDLEDPRGSSVQADDKQQRHNGNDPAKSSFECNMCPKVYSTWMQLGKHQECTHFKGICRNCGKVFDSVGGMMSHRRTCRLPFTQKSHKCCPICKKCIKTDVFKAHIHTDMTNPGKVVYECDMCRQSSKTWSGLQHHMRLGHPECYFCLKVLSEGMLTEHVRTHTRERAKRGKGLDGRDFPKIQGITATAVRGDTRRGVRQYSGDRQAKRLFSCEK